MPVWNERWDGGSKNEVKVRANKEKALPNKEKALPNETKKLKRSKLNKGEVAVPPESRKVRWKLLV